MSLTLALLVPLIFIDMYEPLEHLVFDDTEVNKSSEEPYVHETNKLGLLDKMAFYFLDTTAFKSYLEIIWLWFIAMFVASTISVFMNRKN